jgi:hypothetical protein
MNQNESVNYDWNNLTIMNDEDIDYSTLPEEGLAKLALSGELYIATSAVVELSIRESEAIVPVTWEILSKSLGDGYLQAAALEALFEADLKKAAVYMSKHARSCHPYVLNTIMDLLMMTRNDSDSRFESTSVLISTITERLKGLDSEVQFPKPDVKARFLKLSKMT